MCNGRYRERHRQFGTARGDRTYYGGMGALGITGLIALIAIMAIPVSIVAGAVVYVIRIARKGTAATLVDAMKYRELA